MSDADVQALDYYVNEALDFIEEHGDFRLELPESRRTLVVGSQNAYWTGRILYRSSGRRFFGVEEVEAEDVIRREGGDFDDVTIVSATGSREVVGVAHCALGKGLPVNAILCNPDSELKQAFGDSVNEIVVPGIEEPPSINTASYGMIIYGVTHEDTGDIRRVVQSLTGPEQGYDQFDSFSMLLPDSMLEVGKMAQRKMQEIFGRSISTIATNITNFRHGAAIRDGERELYIGIGIGHDDIKTLRRVPPPPKRRHVICTPTGLGPLGHMMVCYYAIGQMQKQRNDTGFQESLGTYV